MSSPPSRNGSLRIDAWGDCAPCADCQRKPTVREKARRGNRKLHSQRARQHEQGGVVHNQSSAVYVPLRRRTLTTSRTVSSRSKATESRNRRLVLSCTGCCATVRRSRMGCATASHRCHQACRGSGRDPPFKGIEIILCRWREMPRPVLGVVVGHSSASSSRSSKCSRASSRGMVSPLRYARSPRASASSFPVEGRVLRGIVKDVPNVLRSGVEATPLPGIVDAIEELLGHADVDLHEGVVVLG